MESLVFLLSGSIIISALGNSLCLLMVNFLINCQLLVESLRGLFNVHCCFWFISMIYLVHQNLFSLSYLQKIPIYLCRLTTWKIYNRNISELAGLSCWFKANKLSLNLDKISYMLFSGKCNSVLIASFFLHIDNQTSL